MRRIRLRSSNLVKCLFKPLRSFICFNLARHVNEAFRLIKIVGLGGWLWFTCRHGVAS
jgi:hypothetical protein